MKGTATNHKNTGEKGFIREVYGNRGQRKKRNKYVFNFPRFAGLIQRRARTKRRAGDASKPRRAGFLKSKTLSPRARLTVELYPCRASFDIELFKCSAISIYRLMPRTDYFEYIRYYSPRVTVTARKFNGGAGRLFGKNARHAYAASLVALNITFSDTLRARR